MPNLDMFYGLLPYFGGKRKLCPIIFRQIVRHIPRDKWQGMVFVDAFLGSGAVSLYAKAQGFKIICNDIAERSYIAGKTLIENNQTILTYANIQKLFLPNPDNKHLIEKEYVPDVFIKRHAEFLDNAFANANRPIDKYLLLKYIFRVRP
ncbi:MAG: DNA adenine methylase [Candidatus Omnitrophica bacterium]|nr:DNA adenine methylase [Candidatus Omnitrophota bacterium]